ncbi:hypothetical protein OG21DRAFT_1131965 [Imleria badia]|nr:hypothetical protein OG21DRAFT_1131965 [Imleria badia]
MFHLHPLRPLSSRPCPGSSESASKKHRHAADKLVQETLRYVNVFCCACTPSTPSKNMSMIPGANPRTTIPPMSCYSKKPMMSVSACIPLRFGLAIVISIDSLSSTQIPMFPLPIDPKRFLPLENFRMAVWGNDDIFKKTMKRPSGENLRTVEYLDFGDHLRAVQFFCTAIHESKLLVVQEYREAMVNFQMEGPEYKNGACIVGQPGIGKSSFIAYAVIELLRKKQSVAVQVSWNHPGGGYLFFSETSVSHHSGTDLGPLESHTPRVWAFSDSNDIIKEPIAVFSQCPSVRTFQTLSPARLHSQDWWKEWSVRRYIMDLWSDEEIEDLASIFERPIETMRTYLDKWGPTPRILMRLCEIPLDDRQLERDLRIIPRFLYQSRR